MEGIQVSVERAGVNNNIAVIKVGGYIDTTTSAELEHSLDSLLKAGMFKVIIDLGNVDYISSAGWGIFISEIKGIREKGGDLKLVRMIPDVYEVFELLEFHYILKAFDTLEEAVSDFDRGVSDYPSAKSAAPSVASPAQGGTATQTAPPAQSAVGSGADAHAQAGFQSLDDKIRAVAISNPDAGVLKLKKLLSASSNGQINIGFFALRKKLKQLGLNSKAKRIELFRQRAMG
ncbi:MAG TPA: anti-sigma factor antagonist [Bacteroidetes bacterium]|nr:anti-sigma factor antagonist [Bacteroidota bacterium]